KDRATAHFTRPSLDVPNDRITVLDREREGAGHERRTHAVEFAFGDTAGKYQAFSAAAERAMQGAHANRASWRRQKHLFAHFGPAWCDVPERPRDVVWMARHRYPMTSMDLTSMLWDSNNRSLFRLERGRPEGICWASLHVLDDPTVKRLWAE